MYDDERSEEERAVAAVSYLPPLFLFFFCWNHWRKNYFTYYHFCHALLLNGFNLIFIVFSLGLTLWLAAQFKMGFLPLMIGSLLVCSSLLLVSIFSFYCAYQAARGRFAVVPGLTSLYYFIFERRSHAQNLSGEKKSFPMYQLKIKKR